VPILVDRGAPFLAKLGTPNAVDFALAAAIALAVFGANGAQDRAATRAALSAAGEVITKLSGRRDSLRAGIGLHI